MGRKPWGRGRRRVYPGRSLTQSRRLRDRIASLTASPTERPPPSSLTARRLCRSCPSGVEFEAVLARPSRNVAGVYQVTVWATATFPSPRPPNSGWAFSQEAEQSSSSDVCSSASVLPRGLPGEVLEDLARRGPVAHRGRALRRRRWRCRQTLVPVLQRVSPKYVLGRALPRARGSKSPKTPHASFGLPSVSRESTLAHPPSGSPFSRYPMCRLPERVARRVPLVGIPDIRQTGVYEIAYLEPISLWSRPDRKRSPAVIPEGHPTFHRGRRR